VGEVGPHPTIHTQPHRAPAAPATATWDEGHQGDSSWGGGDEDHQEEGQEEEGQEEGTRHRHREEHHEEDQEGLEGHPWLLWLMLPAMMPSRLRRLQRRLQLRLEAAWEALHATRRRLRRTRCKPLQVEGLCMERRERFSPMPPEEAAWVLVHQPCLRIRCA
jgi:hypothetical protein